MLILTRKSQQSIVIDGGRIVVRMLGWKGNQVRISVEAAKDITIDRGEIFRAKVEDGTIKPHQDLTPDALNAL